MLKGALYEKSSCAAHEEKQAMEDSKTDIAWGTNPFLVLDQSRIKDLRPMSRSVNTRRCSMVPSIVHRGQPETRR